MLVLSRKRHEQIVINDNILVTIVDVRGDKVRLGVDAPKEIPVVRKEIYGAIVSARNCSETGDESDSPCRIER